MGEGDCAHPGRMERLSAQKGSGGVRRSCIVAIRKLDFKHLCSCSQLSGHSCCGYGRETTAFALAEERGQADVASKTPTRRPSPDLPLIFLSPHVPILDKRPFGSLSPTKMSFPTDSNGGGGQPVSPCWSASTRPFLSRPQPSRCPPPLARTTFADLSPLSFDLRLLSRMRPTLPHPRLRSYSRRSPKRLLRPSRPLSHRRPQRW